MHDVIIIGGGLAGLQAAHSLLLKGVDNIVVLEARDRVGGRVMHGQVAGIDVDFGGMWLGPSQKRLARLSEVYDVPIYPTHLTGKTIYHLAGKKYYGDRENYDGIFSLREGFIYLRANHQIKAWMKMLDTTAPWEHPDAKALDSMTVETWINKKLKTPRLISMFHLMCFSLFCAEASQVTMLFFLHYLKSGEGLDVLLSADEGGAQNYLFEGGVNRIATKMANELRSRLHLSQPVRSVTRKNNRFTVTTPEENYESQAVVMAVPATMVTDIEFTPNLPQPKAALHRRLIMGSAIKYWVAYSRPFWRDQGFNGSVVADDTPASPCFDVSPPSSELGIIAGFFDGDHALNHSGFNKKERKAVVLNMLSEHFGEQALQPLDYQDTDWTTERWSRGCYGAFAPPGVYSHYGKWLRAPINSLFWAGTETASEWTGYIEGALQSGERAADEVWEFFK